MFAPKNRLAIKVEDCSSFFYFGTLPVFYLFIALAVREIYIHSGAIFPRNIPGKNVIFRLFCLFV